MQHHVIEFNGCWWAELTHGAKLWMAGSTREDLLEVYKEESPLVNNQQMTTMGNVRDLEAFFEFLKGHKEAMDEFISLIHPRS